MSKNYCAKCDSIKNRLLRFGNTQDYASVVLKSKDVMKYRDTDVSVYRTIVDENRNHMEDIALIFMGRRITYRELLTQADMVSDILTSMNIRKGDILLLGANSPQAVSILLACSKIGAGVMILTTRTDPEQFAQTVADMDMRDGGTVLSSLLIRSFIMPDREATGEDLQGERHLIRILL